MILDIIIHQRIIITHQIKLNKKSTKLSNKNKQPNQNLAEEFHRHFTEKDTQKLSAEKCSYLSITILLLTIYLFENSNSLETSSQTFENDLCQSLPNYKFLGPEHSTAGQKGQHFLVYRKLIFNIQHPICPPIQSRVIYENRARSKP